MDIIIFFSKYLILLFITLFVISSIVTILQEEEIIRVNLKSPATLLVVLFHFLTSLILSVNSEYTIDYNAVIYLAMVLLFILLFKVVIYTSYRGCDDLLANIVLFMLDIGFVFLYRIEPHYAIRQLTFATGAVVIAFIIPFLFSFYVTCFEKFKHFDYVFIVLIFGLLLLPTFFGEENYGATNWATLPIAGGVTFQPSEVVKILFIFYLGSAFSRAKGFYNLILPTLVSFFSILILVSQNDFGGSLMYFTIYLVMLYVTTSSELLLLLGISAISFVSFLAYHFVYHIRVRFEIFKDPFQSPYNQGLQILQSLFAIGTKAPFGTGLTKGYPRYVPVVESDFIFAGISEEFGAIFGLLLIVVIFILFMRGIKIAKESNKKYLMLISLGIAVCLVFQSFLIIGGNVKFVPLTGVTLPLISYGGTSVFVTIIMIMVLLKIDLINLSLGEQVSSFKITRKNINRVFVSFLVLYCLLFGYLFRFVFYQSDYMVSSAYNPRVSAVETDHIRGNIYDRNMKELAVTNVDSEGNQTRFYPYDRMLAHTVGSVYNGKTGLELSYNFRLQDPKDELFQMIKSIFFGDEIYGDSIVTTLDADLQNEAYKQLKGKKGAIIIGEAKTGKILSMVSYDDFDPNTYDTDFESLKSDEENTPLINRATQGLYPPASTFKIMSTLYIMENMENYEDYTFQCKGSTTIDGETISCNNGEVHGEVDLEKAFTVSCNSFFASALATMDVSGYDDLAEKMMFNKSIHFDLPLSTSTFTMSEDSSTGEIMQTAIGQGNTLATPLQLYMMVQSVANDGEMLKPYLISEVINKNGKTVSKTKEKVLTQTMTKEEADQITGYMKKVMTEGTGQRGKVSGVEIAGKTGTAEVDGEKSHGLFVGFAPADDPEIVITVVLENSGGSGATLPIVSDLVSYYFNR